MSPTLLVRLVVAAFGLLILGGAVLVSCDGSSRQGGAVVDTAGPGWMAERDRGRL